MADVSPSCAVPGNEDMYGLGIRLGFYLQWSASIMANFLMIKSEIASTRFAIYSYLTAVFVALSIQTARGAGTDLDRYIMLLLCFGAYYSQVAIFLWRFVTCFRKELDPTRWTALAPSLPLRIYSQVILTAIVILQCLFWSTLSSSRAEDACRRYGFLFVPVPLDSTPLKAVNLSLASTLLGLSLLGWIQWWWARGSGREFLKPNRVQSTKRERILVRLGSLVNLAVAGIVIAATELTILWNGVQDVYKLDTLGQLVSFILGVVVFSRVIWVKLRSDPSDSSSTRSSIYYTHPLTAGAGYDQTMTAPMQSFPSLPPSYPSYDSDDRGYAPYPSYNPPPQQGSV